MIECWFSFWGRSKSEGSRTIVTYNPIGVIRSGHVKAEEAPIQPVYAGGCVGRVEVFPEYADGLRDVEGFSHLHLLYHLHKAAPARLSVKPFLNDDEKGVFATRSPRRPNPLGLSVVRLLHREGNVLHVEGMDVLDGAPLIDIKPYVARFDKIEGTRGGWHEAVDEETARKRGRRGYRGTSGGSA